MPQAPWQNGKVGERESGRLKNKIAYKLKYTMPNEQVKTVWPIELLQSWDKNPRDVNPEDFGRLKTQIQLLGQYKPLIIKGNGTVLGGNMRLRAFQELGVKEIWVSIVEPKTEKEELEFALSDNDRTGYYTENKMQQLLKDNPDIQADLFKGDFHPQLSFAQLLGLNKEEIERDEESTEFLKKQFDVYKKGLIKQIVLFFTSEEFDEFFPRLEKVAKDREYKNMTQTVVYLLKYYENNYPKKAD